MVTAPTVKLGDKVRDVISGLEGIVTSRTEYLHGCVRVGVTPEGSKDSKPFEPFVVDEPQLTIVEDNTKPKPAPRHGDRPDVAPRVEPSR